MVWALRRNPIIPLAMLQTYFKIAWRNITKDKQFTILNIIGLSAGIACTLLIYFWVYDELSYDKFFEDSDRIFQVMEQRKSGGDLQLSDESSGLVSETIMPIAPEIAYAAPVAPPGWFQPFTLSVGEKNIKCVGQYAGKDYFSIFSFKLLEGQKGKVLADKNSIVISDQLATKLFGRTTDLIGKAISFQHERDFFISGVFEKMPANSSQQFDFVLSFDYYSQVQSWVKSWSNIGPHNFVLLKEGADVSALNKKIAKVVTQNLGDSTRSLYATKFSSNYVLHTFNHGTRTGGRAEYVKLFSLIALFILAIACINFMNLSTAKAARRMKEVGIKKVIGAGRAQLIIQFLSESMLITMLSVVIALFITWSLLAQFNSLTGKQINIHFDLRLVEGLIAVTLFTGLLSGSYPALYLSRFSPMTILKGKLKTAMGEVLARKGLVIFQFTLSIILIVSVLVIYQQTHFIQTKDPGYNKDNIVRFDTDGKLQNNQENFIAELKKIPGVVNASFTFNNMVGRNFGTPGIQWEGKGPNDYVYFEGFGGGYDFLNTMGIRVIEGRDYSKQFSDEGSKIIINEAAARAMHFEDPVGKTIKLNDRPLQIVGVVKDFHFESLHEIVKPAYYRLISQEANPWYKILAKIKGGQQRETLNRIQQLYESYNPGFPFTYNFLDEAYQKQYENEWRVASLSKYFSALAILISCLGLFGLAAFTAQKRQKEIGIRKVVGASFSNITFMLSKDFLRLVGIAVLIAFPFSFWLMRSWLQGFAYRIDVSPMVFVLAGCSVMFITLLTVSYQSIKSALANPVHSLRSE